MSNVKLLQELPFYDELSSAFSGYARSYKTEMEILKYGNISDGIYQMEILNTPLFILIQQPKQ